MRPSVSEAGMRIMRLLIGHPPKTMAELIEALNVTRTAVTEQLTELIAAGYVQQGMEHCGGRGRPRYLFTATELAMRHLFEGNQDIVVAAMWRAIRNRLGNSMVDLICHDVAKEIADSYDRQMTAKTPRGRIKEFIAILTRNGRLAEMQEKKNCISIKKFNCPFISMAEDSGTVCNIDRLCMQMIVGVPIHQVKSRKEGEPCCTFLFNLNHQDEFEYHDIGAGV